MTNIIHKVTLEDFARSFDVSVDEFSYVLKSFITKTDFSYRLPDGEERDRVVLDVIKKIESDTQIVGAKERQDVWELGWNENLQDFISGGYDLSKLVPKFFRFNQALRFNQNYIIPYNPNFELDYYSVIRRWLFEKYFEEFDTVYEFGCGTGFNLASLAQLYPQKKLHGLDFVPSSVKIVNTLGEVYGWQLKGHLFNMLSPDKNLEIEPNSLVFTIGAVEQLAGKFEPFLQFLVKNSPRLCIHIEPTIELYDENNLVDYMAIKFHRKRGYTENYLTRLRELDAQNQIKIIKTKRLFFGNLYMEGYTLIVWKPSQES